MSETPYVERVHDVIDEELHRAGVERRSLPENVNRALASITARLAADLEAKTRQCDQLSKRLSIAQTNFP